MKLVIYAQDSGTKYEGDIYEFLETQEEIDSYSNSLVDDGTLIVLGIPVEVTFEYMSTAFDGTNWLVVLDHSRKFQDEMAAALQNLKATMNVELYELMYSVAGTNDFNSATLFERTWAKMIAYPGNYNTLGLTARFDRGGVVIGEALTTVTKISNYAQACIDVSDAAEITRMQRIEQYKVDAAALVASYTPSI